MIILPTQISFKIKYGALYGFVNKLIQKSLEPACAKQVIRICLYLLALKLW